MSSPVWRDRVPVWLLPVASLTVCAAAGAVFGQRGLGFTAAVVAAVLISLVGAASTASRKWRAITQGVAVLVAAGIVLATVARYDTTRRETDGAGRAVTAGPPSAPVDLAGEDVTAGDLPSDLRGADLAGAAFTGLDLAGRDFTGADARGADFRGADLAGARFTAADLRGATLDGACLRGAVFTDADLSGSSATGARGAESALSVPQRASVSDWPGPSTTVTHC